MLVIASAYIIDNLDRSYKLNSFDQLTGSHNILVASVVIASNIAAYIINIILKLAYLDQNLKCIEVKLKTSFANKLALFNHSCHWGKLQFGLQFHFNHINSLNIFGVSHFAIN